MAVCTSLPTSIANISAINCFQNIGSVAKVMFQRYLDTSGSAVSITIGTNNPNLQATWTTLKAAADDTHVTVLPEVLHNPDWTGGDNREYGGGDETFGGVPINLGEEFMRFSGELLRWKQKPIQELKAYKNETKLGVYLINDSGEIWGLTDDHDSPAIFKPIPIFSLHIGSKIPGKRSTPDKNMISFAVLENWSDYLYGVTPSDFQALIDL